MFSGLSTARRAASIGGCSLAALICAGAAQGETLINGDSLLISTTTYQDVGAVAGLVAGQSKLPGAKAGLTSTAVSDGSLNTVWNNASGDSSFGVTSAITLSDLNIHTGATLGSLQIDPSQVVTSFPSKSELDLNIATTSSGRVATFMGYNVSSYVQQNNLANGIGLLDVSNSDTTAYKDTTNPVTSFFAPNANQSYAFNRSVVAVGQSGNVSVTQTLAYGGNNGRSAVLLNGQYYTVGNSNNGSGTPSQLTNSTGLESVTPGSTPNSTMINPGYTSISGDKAGKDANFRGLTTYGGNLYFSKGSGSNGVDTVYTVNKQGNIVILPGFSTSPAKTAPDYTPFGLFFANPNTLYVADEGSGDATDSALHAGLEKWSLVNGSWKLDYTLKGGLIGSTYSVNGWNWTETTTGLRNLTGKVNADGTVSLWATTATSSGSGDNGADPNEIVGITDLLSATSLPSAESFSVFDGPAAGLRYGGVAYATPEPSTWAMLVIGFAGLGFAGYRAKRKAAVAA